MPAKVINLYGGPGTGKSSCASDLFALMKWKGVNVELVDEYAKELSWEGNADKLEDQLYIVAKQNRKLWRLKDKVDYIITDSPITLAPLYAKESYMPKYFENLTHEVFQTYDNINIYLKRSKPFSPIGRHHTEEQSKEIDQLILDMLSERNYKFHSIVADRSAKNEILEIIKLYALYATKRNCRSSC